MEGRCCFSMISFQCQRHVLCSLLSALPQLCHVTVWEMIWLLKVPCRNKLGVERDWPGAGMAEHRISRLLCYPSPFTSLQQITVCVCVASVLNLCLQYRSENPHFPIGKCYPALHIQDILMYGIPQFCFATFNTFFGSTGIKLQGDAGHTCR